MHFAPLFKKKLGEVGTILSGHAGNQCYFCHLDTASRGVQQYTTSATAQNPTCCRKQKRRGVFRRA
jgi:hypothetical protein